MDKVKHFIISLILSIYSTELALGCGITKEWCDLIYADNWDWYDLLCDIIGVVMGTMIRYIIIEQWNWF